MNKAAIRLHSTFGKVRKRHCFLLVDPNLCQGAWLGLNLIGIQPCLPL